jgi:membrane protease YdiL (CAAX protease family)
MTVGGEETNAGDELTAARRVWLWTEYALLFYGAPLLLMGMPRQVFFPALFVAASGCLLYLWLDRGFDRSRLWNAAGARGELPRVLAQFAVAAAVLCGLVLWMLPEAWLGFVRSRPGLWALVMVLYPVLSVLPQNLVWRVFLHHRYAPVLPRAWMRVAASAAAFGFVHILLENWLAVALTLAGGVMFGVTYERSRSLLAVSVEHGLYGCLAFTVGIGRYLVLGGVR